MRRSVPPPRFFERHGLNVATYDARTALQAEGALRGDVDFYRRLANGSPGGVLDLGGGTGRVAIPIARDGEPVVLVDRSAPMLALARSKLAAEPTAVNERVRLVESDMTDFRLDRSFGLAIFPFRSFMSLLSSDVQRSCLGTVARHLRSGGRVAVHLFDPWLETIAPAVTTPPMRDRGTVTHPETGNAVRAEALARLNDPLRQVFEEQWLFEEVDASGAVLRSERETLRLRWTYRFEMRYLLELSGFEVEAEYADFVGSPPAYGREQVWLARLP